ncbi:MAG TPA: adenosylcobinamide-GDP ribazoletransferase [Acidimicrobiales bacterium]|nr:adenosylcobinamide-GDP ribazoletransferase [Acidimicrobiales bacterium]
MRRALSFLTPFGPSAVPSRTTLGWFPVVGAAVGLGVGGAWWVAGRLWPPLVAGAVAVVADGALTGFLHLDGLADAADGLLPPLARDRRLEAMADVAVGAFGVCAVGCVLVVRFGAFASMRAVPLAVAALWCLSRTAMAVTAEVVPYVRPAGLASAFVGEPGAADPLRDGVVAVVGVVLVAGLTLASGQWRTAAAAAIAAVAFAGVVAFAWRRIGGFTGDVLGAAGVVAETAGLLALAAKW